MYSTQGKTEKASKHLRQPGQIVPGNNLWLGLCRRFLLESGRRFVSWPTLAFAYLSVRIVGELPNPKITFAGNAHFYRVPRVLRASLTVKIRNEIAAHFLPSDLPSKVFAEIAPKYAGGASLVPREEYIHRAPYGAAEALWLHAINHAQKDTLQQF